MAIVARGTDYSFARPHIGCLRRTQHGDFVVRYVTSLNSKKASTRTEIRQLLTAGLEVCIVYQDGVGDVLRGRNVGRTHARIADARVRALGLPGIPIYFTLDQDPRGLSTRQRLAVRRYLDGVASVLGRHRVGIYGGYQAIQWFVPRWANFGWQTYAWSGGAVSGKAHFRQYHNNVRVCGGAVDLNEAYVGDIGQWPRPGGKPPEKEEEDEFMAMFGSKKDFRKEVEKAVGATGMRIVGEVEKRLAPAVHEALASDQGRMLLSAWLIDALGGDSEGSRQLRQALRDALDDEDESGDE